MEISELTGCTLVLRSLNLFPGQPPLTIIPGSRNQRAENRVGLGTRLDLVRVPNFRDICSCTCGMCHETFTSITEYEPVTDADCTCAQVQCSGLMVSIKQSGNIPVR